MKGLFPTARLFMAFLSIYTTQRVTAQTFISETGIIPLTAYKPAHPMTLWYNQPATAMKCANPWMDYALPVGNGQAGAMVFGGVARDIIQLNEKTLWTGGPTVRGAYQNLGYLYIDNKGASSAVNKNYVRTLDLSTATATSSWMQGGIKYLTEYIASAPDSCIVMRISSSGKSRIDRHISFADAHGFKTAYHSDGTAVVNGRLTTISYCAAMKIVASGGTMSADTTGINIKGAREILIVFVPATDYNATASGYTAGTAGLVRNTVRRAASAILKGWNRLYASHVADYRRLYDRMSLDLEASSNDIPTDSLVAVYNTTATPARQRLLQQLYFQYGRYLLISSSRGIDLPNNLQGIWNNDNNPGWQCDMHANINVQMNYWPAEKTNLSETHLKYLHYLYNMALVQPQWRDYARTRCHQKSGWVNFTENNIFGHCTTWHNDYVEAGAWSCNHLWQHYRYTLDTTFLRRTALPVMLSAVDFWMERLVRDEKDGSWVCPDEWSPEHGPDKTITAHAQQIVWTLFSNTIDAIKEVGLENSGISSPRFEAIKEKFKKIDPGLQTEIYNGTYGEQRNGVKTGDTILREWKYVDYATGNGTEKDHRHLSHLMAVYPFNTISPTSPFFRPAVNSLRLRGLQSQGWSMGWKMCLWARALEGDSCYNIFKQAFNHSRYYRINMSPEAGGVYYNLLDAHSPFQIDGNFGVTAGMAEMLLQNDNDTIMLLPALPKAWACGRATGLKSEGGFTISLEWKNGKLSTSVIRPLKNRRCYLRLSEAALSDSRGKAVPVTHCASGVISFDARAGKTYTLKINK